MRIGIIGESEGWHVRSLQRALTKRGVEALCLPITALAARAAGRPLVSVAEEALERYSVLFVRAIPGGSLEQVIFRVDVLHRLENIGVRIVNSPAVIERSVDKFYTSSLLEDADLPTPRTVVTEQFEQAMAAYHELGGDVVVKPLFGSEGRGIVRVSDAATAYRVFRALELGRYIYYLQEFVPHGCEDIRVFVVGDQVVAAMYRRGNGWKTNVAQGAKGVPLTVDGTLRGLSLRAAQALGADYAGVDILPLENGGYSIVEINGIPGWRGLAAATGINAADALVAYVLDGSEWHP